jgi:heme-degrading monooxygenase HmoA
MKPVGSASTPIWRMRLAFALPLLVTCVLVSPSFAQDPPSRSDPGPVLNELVIEGSSLFSRDDVMWLLRLRTGERLPDSPDEVGAMLQRRYEREGYADVHVTAKYDPQSGRLTLSVEEPRVDDIEIIGLLPDLAARFKRDLSDKIRIGDIYNQRRAARAVRELITASEGALRVGKSGGEGLDNLELVERAGRHVLIVPVTRQRGKSSLTTGTSSREDLFDPVDGFSPGVGFKHTTFDRRDFNYTFVEGYISYKFGREHTGYSIGVERKLSHARGVFVGVEAHDVTATDDLWRLSPSEQTLVAVAFKNTFRDYYRRRGVQAHVSFRPTPAHEIVIASRWDTHEPLQNTTNFSFFRDTQIFRPNQSTAGGDLHAIVLAYTFDTRGLVDAGIAAGFERHLVDDLFRGTRRQDFGSRIDWTSEIAGHGTGGDYTFDRHILNARTYVPLSPRQSFAGRSILGFSGGTLPVERRFAIGGIGSVHGYRFKEAVGEGLILFNAEYRLDLLGGWHHDHAGVLRAVAFFDAGRVHNPIGASTTEWLKGIGAGLQTGPIRVEFGFRLADPSHSKQVLVRLSPSF